MPIRWKWKEASFRWSPNDQRYLETCKWQPCLEATYRTHYPVPNRAKGLALLFWDGYNGRYFLGLLEPGEEEIREAVLKLFSDWDLGEHARFEQELHAYTLSQEEMEEVWEELRWSAQKKAPSKATDDMDVLGLLEGMLEGRKPLDTFTLVAEPGEVEAEVDVEWGNLQAKGRLRLPASEWKPERPSAWRMVRATAIPNICCRKQVEDLVTTLLRGLAEREAEEGWILRIPEPWMAEEEMHALVVGEAVRSAQRKGTLLRVRS